MMSIDIHIRWYVRELYCEWANNLFSNAFEVTIGALTYFPEKMRKFDRDRHDGLVLDDVRDMEFLA